MDFHVAPCSELPNDNPRLHAGCIIFFDPAPALAFETDPEPASVLAPDPDPAPALEPALRLDPAPALDVDLDPALDPDRAAPNLALDFDDEGESDTDPIEIVEELNLDDAVEESPDIVEERQDDADPFLTLARVLVEAASGSGADERALSCLRSMLGQSRFDVDLGLPEATIDALVSAGFATHSEQGLARAPSFTAVLVGWAAVLRGESEDYGPCGASPLDEWAANFVALCLGNHGLAPTIRRELRRRGVAAFGFASAA